MPTSPRTSETSEEGPAFYPPRAADAPWWRRGARSLDRRFGWISGKVPAVRDQDLAAVLSVIPGLGHLLVERRAGKAAFFFAAYWAVLAWSWLFSGLSAFWTAMLPLSFHQWIISDCCTKARARAGLPPLAGRALMLFSAVIGFSLLLAYRQAGQILSRRGAAVRVDTDRFAPILDDGDRLIFAPRPAYARGDIVYSRTAGGLERVVGLAGDEIAVGNGALLVNGTPPTGENRPLGKILLGDLESARMSVPAGSYCVFFPARNEGLRGSRLLGFFMIPRDGIDGKLILRYYPEVRRFQ